MDDETDILLCGGGAGGGKSRTCLTKALRYINDPSARIMIVRRSYPMLKLSGGLIDESKSIYTHFKGIFKVQTSTWHFPNGATIQFAPIPDDVKEWQGAQITHFLVDEAAEFTEDEILFLISRLRSATFKGHKSITLTCNPSRESFLYDWVQYSLDENTGVPLPGTENRIRYMVNIGGKTKFADSADELWERYGEPGGYCRDPAKGKVNFIVRTFRFIPLTIYDNPILLKNDPGYLANLLAQNRVDQLRYLHGSWTARATGSGFFRREWVKFVEPHEVPTNVTSRVRSWDLAASVVSEANKDPDWTAGVKMSRDKLGRYYIEDVRRFRKLTDGVVKEIITTAISDGLDDCKVTIPKDPGAGGKTANSFFLKTLAENGVYARSVQVSGHVGKIKRFLPFCTLAESGFVYVVRGDWNEEWLTELEFFEGERNQKDDQVDATADAFNTLSKEIMLPTFAVPILEQASPIPTA
jgi:predicted phage terminase large subunit-like protein